MTNDHFIQHLNEPLKKRFAYLEAVLRDAKSAATEGRWALAQEELRTLEVEAARLAHALEEEKQ